MVLGAWHPPGHDRRCFPGLQEAGSTSSGLMEDATCAPPRTSAGCTPHSWSSGCRRMPRASFRSGRARPARGAFARPTLLCERGGRTHARAPRRPDDDRRAAGGGCGDRLAVHLPGHQPGVAHAAAHHGGSAHAAPHARLRRPARDRHPRAAPASDVPATAALIKAANAKLSPRCRRLIKTKRPSKLSARDRVPRRSRCFAQRRAIIRQLAAAENAGAHDSRHRLRHSVRWRGGRARDR